MNVTICVMKGKQKVPIKKRNYIYTYIVKKRKGCKRAQKKRTKIALFQYLEKSKYYKSSRSLFVSSMIFATSLSSFAFSAASAALISSIIDLLPATFAA